MGWDCFETVSIITPIFYGFSFATFAENLIRSYPLSAMELAGAVQEILPKAKYNDIWQTIKSNKLKGNLDYSAYNFRNKSQENKYKETKTVPSSIPSIYNSKAVDLIVKILRDDT